MRKVFALSMLLVSMGCYAFDKNDYYICASENTADKFKLSIEKSILTISSIQDELLEIGDKIFRSYDKSRIIISAEDNFLGTIFKVELNFRSGNLILSYPNRKSGNNYAFNFQCKKTEPFVTINILKNIKEDFELLEQALTLFFLMESGSYPTSDQGLESLKTNPGDLKNPSLYPDGGYIYYDLPLDPWGNPYVYIYPGQYGEYDLVSLGADGQPDGIGVNADIVGSKISTYGSVTIIDK